MPYGPYASQRPVGSSSRAPVPMDPSLITPLPEDDDDDFPPAHKLLATLAKPASKVAGSRRPALSAKAKGKQKEVDSQNSKRKHGRAAGTANYSDEDMDQLLDLLEAYLPPGAKAWNRVGDEFNGWASENGRPERTVKSLEAKFKQVCFFHFSDPAFLI